LLIFGTLDCSSSLLTLGASSASNHSSYVFILGAPSALGHSSFLLASSVFLLVIF
jgi:hypothetical protein